MVLVARNDVWYIYRFLRGADKLIGPCDSLELGQLSGVEKVNRLGGTSSMS